MTRLLVAGLLGLLALGAAGVDLASRSAGLLIQDMSLTALGTVDQPSNDEPVVSAVEPSATPDPLEAVTAEPVPITTVQNILLVGTDSRAGLTEDQMREMDAFDHGGELTDTIMWVQYLPDTQAVRMVAFPRDLAITLDSGRREKINAVHPIDGPNALIEQVEEIVGEDLDHYVEVDLAGLVALTDAVGGVEVCLSEPLVDETVGTIDAGRQVLDGIDAGRFVRSRKSSDSFGTGTGGRAARQQYFLRRAMDEVLSAGTLTNPSRLRALVDVAARSVVVDDELSLSSMYSLANTFRTIEPKAIESAVVPVVAYTDGGYFERLDDSADTLFDALRDGEPFPEETRSEREGDREELVTAGATPSPSPGPTERFTIDDTTAPKPSPSPSPSPSGTLDPAGVSPSPSATLDPAGEVTVPTEDGHDDPC